MNHHERPGESQGFSPNPRAMVSRSRSPLAPAPVLRMPPSLPPTVAQINQALGILFSQDFGKENPWVTKEVAEIWVDWKGSVRTAVSSLGFKT